MPVAAPAVVIIHRWLRTVPAVVLVLAMLAPAHAQPVVDPPERPAPEGLLDLGGEGYVGGRFVTAPGVEGGRDTLPWQAPAFAAPPSAACSQSTPTRKNSSRCRMAASVALCAKTFWLR